MARRSLMPFKNDLEPFNWLRREVDHLFDNLWGTPTFKSQLGHFPMRVNIDVCETENDLTITADLPGLEEKDIKVEVNNNILLISGEKKIDHEEKGKNFHRVERSSGFFSRSVQLPLSIDENNIEAKFKNGVLIITLPKSLEAQSKAKKIEVKKG